ncbi:MAG: hypothetical protein DRI23_13600, partial [Candidatus Cloacimonadota bacterium]
MRILYLFTHDIVLHAGVSNKVISQSNAWKYLGHEVKICNMSLKKNQIRLSPFLKEDVYFRKSVFYGAKFLFRDIDEFNPDVIIGSKAAQGNMPPDEFDILAQIENLVMKPSNYQIDSTRGILLDMNFKKQSLLAFDKLDEFVEVGYNITMEKIDSIRMLVGERTEDTTDLRKRREAFVNSIPELRFNEVEIEGLNGSQRDYVERSLFFSDSISDVKEMKTEYLKLVHDKSLFYLYPRAVYKPEDSLFKMKLRVIPQTPLEGRFGHFFSTTGLAQPYLGLSYRQLSEVSTHLKGSIQFGRFYNGVNLGFRFDYPARTPLFFKGNFNYNGFQYNSYNTNFFFEDL